MAFPSYTPKETALDLPDYVNGKTVLKQRVVCTDHHMGHIVQTVVLDIERRFYYATATDGYGEELKDLRTDASLTADNQSYVNAMGVRVARYGKQTPAEWDAEIKALRDSPADYWKQGLYFLRVRDLTPVIITDMILQYMRAEFLPAPAPAA